MINSIFGESFSNHPSNKNGRQPSAEFVLESIFKGLFSGADETPSKGCQFNDAFNEDVNTLAEEVAGINEFLAPLGVALEMDIEAECDVAPTSCCQNASVEEVEALNEQDIQNFVRFIGAEGRELLLEDETLTPYENPVHNARARAIAAEIEQEEYLNMMDTYGRKLAEEKISASGFEKNDSPLGELPDFLVNLLGGDSDIIEEMANGFNDLLGSVLFGLQPESAQEPKVEVPRTGFSTYEEPLEYAGRISAEEREEIISGARDREFDNGGEFYLAWAKAAIEEFENLSEVVEGIEFSNGDSLTADDFRLDRRYVGTLIEDARRDIFMLDCDGYADESQRLGWIAYGDTKPSMPQFPATLIRVLKEDA